MLPTYDFPSDKDVLSLLKKLGSLVCATAQAKLPSKSPPFVFFLLNLCDNISPGAVGPYPHAQICRCHLNSPPSGMQAIQLAKKYFIWALLRQCNCARFLLGYQRLIRRCVQAPASLGIFRVPCSTRGS